MRPRESAETRARSERGVTLAELVAVVAIDGLFAAVAIPEMGSYIRAARVRSGNDGLVNDLRAARYIAVTNRTSETLTFNAGAGTYSYPDIRGNTVTRTLDTGVTMTVTNGPVTFGADGGISTSPPTIVVTGRYNSSLTDTYTITVNATGKVTSAFVRS